MGPEEEKGIWQRIRRFLEPESAGETAALVGTSMVPGVGTALDVADIAAGVQDRDPVRIGIGALAAALPFVSSSGLRGIAGLLKSPRKIRGYHGSPHDFDRFRWDSGVRGGGEGVQAFADGLYIAEAPEVASSYRPRPIEKYVYDGADLGQDYGIRINNALRHGVREGDLQLELRAMESDAESRFALQRRFLHNEIAELEELDNAINAIERGEYFRPSDFRSEDLRNANWNIDTEDLFKASISSVRRAVDGSVKRHQMAMDKAIERLGVVQDMARDFNPAKFSKTTEGGGKLYTVDIHADRSDFIDLDRPIKDQPKWIQNVFPGRMRDLAMPRFNDAIRGSFPDEVVGVRPVTVGTDIVQPRVSRELDDAAMDAARAIARDMPEDVVANLWENFRTAPENWEEILTRYGYAPRAGLGGHNPLRMRGIGSLRSMEQHMNPVSVAKELRRHGIPGVKFYDGMSRSAQKGTRNFVVFDPDLIEIVDKKRKGGMIK